MANRVAREVFGNDLVGENLVEQLADLGYPPLHNGVRPALSALELVEFRDIHQCSLRMELAPFSIEVMEVQPGAIQSNFGANASQHAEALISESSPWWPLREGIRARANVSQENPTPAAEFAAGLLRAARQSPRPRLVRIGNGCHSLPLMARLLPQALLEKGLMKRFGLNRYLN